MVPPPDGTSTTTDLAIHEAEMAHVWLGLRIPALVARCERVARLLGAHNRAAATDLSDSSDLSPQPRLLTVLHRLRHGGERSTEGSAPERVDA